MSELLSRELRSGGSRQGSQEQKLQMSSTSPLRHPESLPVAGIRTEPDLVSPGTAWKREDELFRSTGHRGQAYHKTTVSADAPTTALLPFVPTSPRASLFARESPHLLARARSAGAVSRGVFSGSSVEPPPPSRQGGRRQHTIVHVDKCNPAYRLLDESTVESAHARAVAAHGPAAFALSSGFGAETLNVGVPMRSVTPLWSAHLRLTTLDETLSKMRLSGVVPGGVEDAESIHHLFEHGRPAFSRVGAGTFHFTPLPPAMVPLGTPRRVHVHGQTGKSPRATSSGGGKHSRKHLPGSFPSGEGEPASSTTTSIAEDLSAQAILAWVPCGVAATAAAAASAATAKGGGSSSSSSSSRKGGAAALNSSTSSTSSLDTPLAHIQLVCDLPPPLPLLQPTGTAHSFVSRASRHAVTPRGHVSALEKTTTRWLNARVQEGGEGGGEGGGGGSSAPSSPRSITKSGGRGGAYHYHTYNPYTGGGAGGVGGGTPGAQQQQFPLPSTPLSYYPGGGEGGEGGGGSSTPMQTQQQQQQQQQTRQHPYRGVSTPKGGGGTLFSSSTTTATPRFPPSPGKAPSSPTGGRAPSNSPFLPSRGGNSSIITSSSSITSASSITSTSTSTLAAKHANPLHSSEVIVGPSSVRDANGVLRAVSRTGVVARVSDLNSNPGLVRMRSGEEMLAGAALQARALYRLHAQHDVDLTHEFIEQGTWGVMNIRGHTLNPKRHTLDKRPMAPAAAVAVGGAGGEGGAGGVGSSTSNSNSNSNSNSDNYYYANGAQSVAGFQSGGGEAFELGGGRVGGGGEGVGGGGYGAFPSHTPLGQAFAEVTQREADTPFSIYQQYEADKWRAGGGGKEMENGGAGAGAPHPHSPPPTKDPTGAVDAIAQWEASHEGEGMTGMVSVWPKRKLREKVEASGLKVELGLGGEGVLEGASKAVLLSAYQRIPSTRRMLGLYAGKGWATNLQGGSGDVKGVEGAPQG